MRTSSCRKAVGRAGAACLWALCIAALIQLLSSRAAAQSVPGGQQSPYEKARGFPEPAPEHEKVFRGERPTKEQPDAGARQRAIAAAQIREDFSGIQLLNNSLRAQPPAAQAVSKAAAEIRKRARRLKTNLALPAEAAARAGDGGKDGAGGAALAELLAELDGHVRSFVTNPIFGDVQSIDARLAEGAERELEAIIEVSGRLARLAAAGRR